MYDYLWENNKDHLDDIALSYFQRNFNYRRLFQEIDQCAKSLFALNVKSGDIITVQALTIPQTVVLLYAISKIGAIANLVYISESERGVNRLLKHTNSKLYFLLDGVYEQLSAVLDGTNVETVVTFSLEQEMSIWPRTMYQISHKKRKCLCQDNIWTWQKFMRLTPNNYNDTTVDALRPVAMVYTGGTTGTPKAVVLTNYGINELVSQYKKAQMGFSRQDTFLDVLPPFIAFGLTVSLHLPLSIGCKTILSPGATINDTAKMFLKYKPNYYVAGPAQIEAILNQPQAQKMDFSFLKLLATGGDALSEFKELHINNFLRAHHSQAFVLQGYGMSELSATVCTENPRAIRCGSVGIPLPDVNIKIVNEESDIEVNYGQSGEICIMSPTVMTGYYDAIEETNAVLKLHSDGQFWLHTGDIGTLDTDGYLTIVGRIKRMIYISKSAVYHKVFPKQLEEQFEKLPGVHAVIVGNSTCPENCSLVAFVAADDGGSVAENELRLFANKNFEIYERPEEYRFIKDFPRTSLGKVDYRALERLAAQHE